jgi:hypothetical protein
MKEIKTKNSGNLPETPPRNPFQRCTFWLRNHIPLTILIVVFAVAAFIRLWAAEISSGPDVSQFWAFAKVFQTHGLDFYRYADAQGSIFPMQGWGFVYPPVWLVIERISLAFVPNSTLPNIGGNFVADPSWRLAMKVPIILADLAIGLILYWAVPGSKRKKVLFASLWLLHPTAWFQSGVFGQFDSIAAAFLLTFVVLLQKGKDRLAFVFAGLAVMTKQHTLAAVALVLIVCARTMNFKRLLPNVAIFAGVVAVISVPFIVTGNLVPYARSILFAGSPPGYQDPLCFAFSGFGALFTFLHNLFEWDMINWLKWLLPTMAAGYIASAIATFKRRISVLQAALIGFLVFIAFYCRINYQYLIIYIPLALLLAASSKHKIESMMALVIGMLPAVWLWISNIPWWFHDTKPGYEWVPDFFSHIGLFQRYLPDWVYTTFALAIMATSITFIVLVFANWTEPEAAPEQS